MMLSKLLVFCALLVAAPLLTVEVRAQIPVKVPEAKIMFVPPPHWKRQEKKNLPTKAQVSIVVYLGPIIKEIPTGFNLVVQNLPPDLKTIRAEVMAAALADSMRNDARGYKNVVSGVFTAGGEPAAHASGSLVLNGTEVRMKQVMLVHKGKQYAFSFTVAESAYDKQVGAFDKMIASMKWL